MKKFLYISFYFLSPLILAGLLFSSNPNKYSNITWLTSMLLGVSAYTWLSWQFVISARPKFIERIFGMDHLYRVHGVMAIVSLVFVGIHRYMNLKVFSESTLTNMGQASFIIFIVVSTLSVVLMATPAILERMLKPLKSVAGRIGIFKYRSLKLIHNISTVALILLLIHVLMTSAVRASLPVFLGYVSYFIISSSFYIYHKVIKLWVAAEELHKITGVTQESSDMWRIDFEVDDDFYYMPGQFAFFRLLSDKNRELHPFTISSSPTEQGKMSITVKELGDFTKEIGKIKPGDEIIMEGPYGRFSYLNYPYERQIVFIVGGVGVTPALSMIKHMADTHESRRVLLVWGVRKVSDIIRVKELNEAMKFIPNLRIVPVVSDEPEYTGEKGYLNKYMLTRMLDASGISMYSAGYYLCGPSPLMKSAGRILKSLRIPKTLIHDERFSL